MWESNSDESSEESNIAINQPLTGKIVRGWSILVFNYIASTIISSVKSLMDLTVGVVKLIEHHHKKTDLIVSGIVGHSETS